MTIFESRHHQQHSGKSNALFQLVISLCSLFLITSPHHGSVLLVQAQLRTRFATWSTVPSDGTFAPTARCFHSAYSLINSQASFNSPIQTNTTVSSNTKLYPNQSFVLFGGLLLSNQRPNVKGLDFYQASDQVYQAVLRQGIISWQRRWDTTSSFEFNNGAGGEQGSGSAGLTQQTASPLPRYGHNLVIARPSVSAASVGAWPTLYVYAGLTFIPSATSAIAGNPSVLDSSVYLDDLWSFNSQPDQVLTWVNIKPPSFQSSANLTQPPPFVNNALMTSAPTPRSFATLNPITLPLSMLRRLFAFSPQLLTSSVSAYLNASIQDSATSSVNAFLLFAGRSASPDVYSSLTNLDFDAALSFVNTNSAYNEDYDDLWLLIPSLPAFMRIGNVTCLQSQVACHDQVSLSAAIPPLTPLVSTLISEAISMQRPSSLDSALNFLLQATDQALSYLIAFNQSVTDDASQVTNDPSACSSTCVAAREMQTPSAVTSGYVCNDNYVISGNVDGTNSGGHAGSNDVYLSIFCPQTSSGLIMTQSRVNASEGQASDVHVFGGEARYVWSFGGFDCASGGVDVFTTAWESSCFNRLLSVLDIYTLVWYTFTPPSSGSQFSLWPEARAYASMAIDQVHSQIWLYGGGYSTPSSGWQALGTLHLFDIATMSWLVLNTQGSSPLPAFGASLTWMQPSSDVPGTLFLFGGCDQSLTPSAQLLMLLTSSAVTAANFLATGAGLTASVAGQNTVFYLTAYAVSFGDSSSNNNVSLGAPLPYALGLSSFFTVSIQASLGQPPLPLPVLELGQGVYSCNYTLYTGTDFTLLVAYNSQPITNSPFNISLLPASVNPAHSSVVASGSHSNWSVVAPASRVFVLVQTKDSYFNNEISSISPATFQLFWSSPNAVLGLGGGTGSGGSSQGEQLARATVRSFVSSTPSSSSPPLSPQDVFTSSSFHSPAARSPLSFVDPSSVVPINSSVPATHSHQFHLLAQGDNITASSSSSSSSTGGGSGVTGMPIGVVQPLVFTTQDNRDGTYTLSFLVPSPNDFLLLISLQGIPLASSPYYVTVIQTIALPNTIFDALLALSLLTVVYITLAACAVLYYRRHRLVRSASCGLLLLICFGCLLCVIAVPVFLREDSISCRLFPILLSTGFVLAIGALYAKAARLYVADRIINHSFAFQDEPDSLKALKSRALRAPEASLEAPSNSQLSSASTSGSTAANPFSPLSPSISSSTLTTTSSSSTSSSTKMSPTFASSWSWVLISNASLMLPVLFLLCLETCINITWLVTSPLSIDVGGSDGSGSSGASSSSSYEECSGLHSTAFAAVSLAFNGLLALLGLRLALRIRNIAEVCSEAKLIAAVFYNLVLCLLICIPLTVTAATNTFQLYIIPAACIFWVTVVTINLVVLPRIFYIFYPPFAYTIIASTASLPSSSALAVSHASDLNSVDGAALALALAEGPLIARSSIKRVNSRRQSLNFNKKNTPRHKHKMPQPDVHRSHAVNHQQYRRQASMAARSDDTSAQHAVEIELSQPRLQMAASERDTDDRRSSLPTDEEHLSSEAQTNSSSSSALPSEPAANLAQPVLTTLDSAESNRSNSCLQSVLTDIADVPLDRTLRSSMSHNTLRSSSIQDNQLQSQHLEVTGARRISL